MKKIILSILLLCTAPLMSACLQDKFTHARAGDFVVTAQEGNYSLLFIRSLTPETLLLEEISIPEPQVSLKNFDWKKWTSEKAPGHTSWTLYEIDRSSGTLTECFSYSKNGWLYLEESGQFLTRLLTLPLERVPTAERKKIGPSPASGESDTRSLWIPPLIVEGKKIQKPAFDVQKTRWPDDSSQLSLCAIELYFAKDLPSFPFPYWLEVQSPHYNFKLRTVDSGKDLISPMIGPMPHRPPRILGSAQRGQEFWKLLIQTPPYFQKMSLFVTDIFGREKTTTPVAFVARDGSKKGEIILEIASSELKDILKEGHRYQWVLIPEGCADIRVESDPFIP